MEMNQGFAYAYGWNVYYQKILSTRSVKNEGLIASQRGWFWVFVSTIFVLIPQTATLSIVWGDLNAFIKCLSINMSVTLAVVKHIVLQSQRKNTDKLLAAMDKDWARVRTKVELDIMLVTAKISRFISILSFLLSNIMVFVYICYRTSLMVNNVDSNVDSRLTFGMLYDSYFPFDTTKLTIFVPLWIGQFFGTFLTTFSYGGLDCLLSMFVLHLCGQLRIIRHSLKYLVNDTTIKDRAKYWQNLIAIVEKHEQLNKLTIIVQEMFSGILLFQILVCSLGFCFQGYAMFTTLFDRNGTSLPISEVIFSIILGIFTIIHLFMHCYVGDRLLVESTSVSDDFYETEWYNLAPEEAKAFLFVCHRSMIPLEVKAGKFCIFNLQLFGAILKNSMGYLSMLMAMKERLITD